MSFVIENGFLKEDNKALLSKLKDHELSLNKQAISIKSALMKFQDSTLVSEPTVRLDADPVSLKPMLDTVSLSIKQLESNRISIKDKNHMTLVSQHYNKHSIPVNINPKITETQQYLSSLREQRADSLKQRAQKRLQELQKMEKLKEHEQYLVRKQQSNQIAIHFHQEQQSRRILRKLKTFAKYKRKSSIALLLYNMKILKDYLLLFYEKCVRFQQSNRQGLLLAKRRVYDRWIQHNTLLHKRSIYAESVLRVGITYYHQRSVKKCLQNMMKVTSSYREQMKRLADDCYYRSMFRHLVQRLRENQERRQWRINQAILVKNLQSISRSVSWYRDLRQAAQLQLKRLQLNGVSHTAATNGQQLLLLPSISFLLSAKCFHRFLAYLKRTKRYYHRHQTLAETSYHHRQLAKGFTGLKKRYQHNRYRKQQAAELALYRRRKIFFRHPKSILSAYFIGWLTRFQARRKRYRVIYQKINKQQHLPRSSHSHSKLQQAQTAYVWPRMIQALYLAKVWSRWHSSWQKQQSRHRQARRTQSLLYQEIFLSKINSCFVRWRELTSRRRKRKKTKTSIGSNKQPSKAVGKMTRITSSSQLQLHPMLVSRGKVFFVRLSRRCQLSRHYHQLAVLFANQHSFHRFQKRILIRLQRKDALDQKWSKRKQAKNRKHLQLAMQQWLVYHSQLLDQRHRLYDIAKQQRGQHLQRAWLEWKGYSERYQVQLTSYDQGKAYRQEVTARKAIAHWRASILTQRGRQQLGSHRSLTTKPLQQKKQWTKHHQGEDEEEEEEEHEEEEEAVFAYQEEEDGEENDEEVQHVNNKATRKTAYQDSSNNRQQPQQSAKTNNKTAKQATISTSEKQQQDKSQPPLNQQQQLQQQPQQQHQLSSKPSVKTMTAINNSNIAIQQVQKASSSAALIPPAAAASFTATSSFRAASSSRLTTTVPPAATIGSKASSSFRQSTTIANSNSSSTNLQLNRKSSYLNSASMSSSNLNLLYSVASSSGGQLPDAVILLRRYLQRWHSRYATYQLFAKEHHTISQQHYRLGLLHYGWQTLSTLRQRHLLEDEKIAQYRSTVQIPRFIYTRFFRSMHAMIERKQDHKESVRIGEKQAIKREARLLLLHWLAQAKQGHSALADYAQGKAYHLHRSKLIAFTTMQRACLIEKRAKLAAMKQAKHHWQVIKTLRPKFAKWHWYISFIQPQQKQAKKKAIKFLLLKKWSILKARCCFLTDYKSFSSKKLAIQQATVHYRQRQIKLAFKLFLWKLRYRLAYKQQKLLALAHRQHKLVAKVYLQGWKVLWLADTVRYADRIQAHSQQRIQRSMREYFLYLHARASYRRGQRQAISLYYRRRQWLHSFSRQWYRAYHLSYKQPQRIAYRRAIAKYTAKAMSQAIKQWLQWYRARRMRLVQPLIAHRLLSNETEREEYLLYKRQENKKRLLTQAGMSPIGGVTAGGAATGRRRRVSLESTSSTINSYDDYDNAGSSMVATMAASAMSSAADTTGTPYALVWMRHKRYRSTRQVLAIFLQRMLSVIYYQQRWYTRYHLQTALPQLSAKQQAQQHYCTQHLLDQQGWSRWLQYRQTIQLPTQKLIQVAQRHHAAYAARQVLCKLLIHHERSVQQRLIKKRLTRGQALLALLTWKSQCPGVNQYSAMLYPTIQGQDDQGRRWSVKGGDYNKGNAYNSDKKSRKQHKKQVSIVDDEQEVEKRPIMNVLTEQEVENKQGSNASSALVHVYYLEEDDHDDHTVKGSNQQTTSTKRRAVPYLPLSYLRSKIVTRSIPLRKATVTSIAAAHTASATNSIMHDRFFLPSIRRDLDHLSRRYQAHRLATITADYYWPRQLLLTIQHWSQLAHHQAQLQGKLADYNHPHRTLHRAFHDGFLQPFRQAQSTRQQGQVAYRQMIWQYHGRQAWQRLRQHTRQQRYIRQRGRQRLTSSWQAWQRVFYLTRRYRLACTKCQILLQTKQQQATLTVWQSDTVIEAKLANYLQKTVPQRKLYQYFYLHWYAPRSLHLKQLQAPTQQRRQWLVGQQHYLTYRKQLVYTRWLAYLGYHYTQQTSKKAAQRFYLQAVQRYALSNLLALRRNRLANQCYLRRVWYRYRSQHAICKQRKQLTVQQPIHRLADQLYYARYWSKWLHYQAARQAQRYHYGVCSAKEKDWYQTSYHDNYYLVVKKQQAVKTLQRLIKQAKQRVVDNQQIDTWYREEFIYYHFHSFKRKVRRTTRIKYNSTVLLDKYYWHLQLRRAIRQWDQSTVQRRWLIRQRLRLMQQHDVQRRNKRGLHALAFYWLKKKEKRRRLLEQQSEAINAADDAARAMEEQQQQAIEKEILGEELDQLLKPRLPSEYEDEVRYE